MSSHNGAQPGEQPPVERRAEEVMARVGERASRLGARIVGRVREEVEDIVAEAQSLRRGEHRDS